MVCADKFGTFSSDAETVVRLRRTVPFVSAGSLEKKKELNLHMSCSSCTLQRLWL